MGCHHYPYKVFLNTSRMNVSRHFFTERIAGIWNSLQPSIVDLRSLLLFKKTINHVHDINGLSVYVVSIVIVSFFPIAICYNYVIC